MSRAFPVILARSAAKAARLTPDLKVTVHPAGGYCIAEKQPGSGNRALSGPSRQQSVP